MPRINTMLLEELMLLVFQLLIHRYSVAYNLRGHWSGIQRGHADSPGGQFESQSPEKVLSAAFEEE